MIKDYFFMFCQNTSLINSGTKVIVKAREVKPHRRIFENLKGNITNSAKDVKMKKLSRLE